jgi:hypothetical protein
MAKKKRGGKKRKLPKALQISRQCAVEVGIKPFKKWSAADHRKVDACVLKKTRKKK